MFDTVFASHSVDRHDALVRVCHRGGKAPVVWDILLQLIIIITLIIRRICHVSGKEREKSFIVFIQHSLPRLAKDMNYVSTHSRAECFKGCVAVRKDRTALHKNLFNTYNKLVRE